MHRSAAQRTGGQQQAKSASLHHRLPRWRCAPRPFERNTCLTACHFLADYTNPGAFSENLVTCMKNDWSLDDTWLLSVFPSLAKVTGSVMGAEVKVDFVKAEVKKDPQSALQMIKAAYLKLVSDAKHNRKKGDPWPVIVIDEANLLTGWEDKTSLESLLAFFVYITKQEQLAHVVLATSDTFLTQWLESGAPRLAVAALSGFHCFALARTQAPSRPRSAPRAWWATCRARRRAHSSSTTSCRPTRTQLAPTRPGSACTTSVAATRGCC